MKIRHGSVYIAMLFICSSAAGLYVTEVYGDSPEIHVLTYSSHAESTSLPETIPSLQPNQPAPTVETTQTIDENIVVPVAVETVRGTTTEAEPEIIPPPEVAVLEEEVTPKETEKTPAVVKPTRESEAKDIPQTFDQKVISEIHRLTNNIRQDEGLNNLSYDSSLAQIAEIKSEDMSDRGYFSHIDPDGCDFTCLLKAHQYRAIAWGENLIQYSSTRPPTATELAEYFLNSWIESSGHRDNILNGQYTHEGIGLTQVGNKFYATVHFADPR